MPRHNHNANPEHNPVVVRFKKNGKFFSRHFRVKFSKPITIQANGIGTILSVRKVHPLDIIGTVKSMNLQDIIGGERRQPDVILNGTTLDSIVFPALASKQSSKSRTRFKGKYNKGNQQEV